MLIFSTAVHSSRARAVAPQKGIQATEIEQALAKQTTRQRRKVHKNYDYCFSIYWIYSRRFFGWKRLLLAQWKMDFCVKMLKNGNISRNLSVRQPDSILRCDGSQLAKGSRFERKKFFDNIWFSSPLFPYIESSNIDFFLSFLKS